MKMLNSYRYKIFISLWVFGLFLVVIYHLTGHSIALLTHHRDEVGNFELKKEIAHFFEHYKKDSQMSYPNSRFYKSYLGTAELPGDLRDKIEKLDIGYHFIRMEKNTGPDKAYYVAVARHPHLTERFFLLFDYTRYANEYVSFQLFKMSNRFFLALVIVGVLAAIIGLFVSKMLTAPINRLVSQVKELDPEHLPTDFSQNYKDDEVGLLAAALEKSMQRINEFIEREKNFTRDSSHELRTPVTVIKGAVELIRQLPECRNKTLAGPVSRIERSLKNMEEIIKAFLWLAREQHVKVKAESCLVGDIVKNAVEDNRYLMAAKPISLDMKLEDNPRIAVPESVFRIAVVNLIRNAFIHTNQGRITINVKSACIQITNTGMQISANQLGTIKEPFQKGISSQGFGIGLAIVERLCRRFDFKLDIESDTESNTRVRLSLKT